MPCRRQRGTALMVVIILLLVFLTASGLLAARVLSDARQVKDAAARQQSLHLADGGIRALSERLRAHPGEPPGHLRLDGELETGRFEVVAVRLDTPGAQATSRPVYVVTSRAWCGGTHAFVSGRGDLWYDGLRFEAIEHGKPPESWYELEGGGGGSETGGGSSLRPMGVPAVPAR